MNRIITSLFAIALCALLSWSLSSQQRLPQPSCPLESVAQQLLDHKFGPGVAWVKVHQIQGQGRRKLERKGLGDKAFVVSSKSKKESYKGKYLNETHTEELSFPESREYVWQDTWTEKISVVVVTTKTSADLVPLLEVGLGLDRERGDQVLVTTPQNVGQN